MTNDKEILEHLAHSEVFCDYVHAFNETTGMPLSLRPVESWQIIHQDGHQKNPICAMFSSASRTCSACLEAQQRTSNLQSHEPQTTVCYAGLVEASVPVRSGEHLLGFLQTGEVIVGEPSAEQFEEIAQRLGEWGTKLDLRKLEVAYFCTKALTQKQYTSILKLLSIFAQHLGLMANQLVMRITHTEPENMVKARHFIDDHHDEALALGDVAHAVNMSTFYFCKIFKKATGLTFTDYLARLRVEKAKELLAKPNVRISEVAFEVGFQSLTHFNRTFHRVLGESPSEYRAAISRQWVH